ncbi:MAG: hypothetical protein U0L73_02715 [Ruminococcus bromii]|nr:hypothetical protein [Ruminococcus bromii]
MISEQTRNKLTTIAENEQKVYNNGVADGMRTQYDAFWDNIQEGGKRTYYSSAFYVGPSSSRKKVWTDTIFKPKYDLNVVGSGQNMFYGCGFTNLKEILIKQGVKLDTSQCTRLQALFGESAVTHIPEISAINADNTYGLHTMCSYAEGLISIDKLKLKEDGKQEFTNTFNYCRKLQDLVIEGVIGTNFNAQHSPLSVASLKSIVKHLKSYLGTSSEYAYTLTVKASAWEALEAAGFTDEDLEWIEEVLGIDKDTWLEFEFAWEETLEVLRWNLVLAS